MWRWLVSLSRTRRARRAATAIIVPLVEASRRRLGGIAEATWSDPYVIGFVTMLITLVSRIEVGRLDDSALGAVQTGAWQDITGRRGGAVGEDMLCLGAARNRSFEAGCRDAVTFGSILVAQSVRGARTDPGWPLMPTDLDARTVPAEDGITPLWEQFFDAHVAYNWGADAC